MFKCQNKGPGGSHAANRQEFPDFSFFGLKKSKLQSLWPSIVGEERDKY